VKKVILYALTIYIALINLTLASQSIETLKSKIIDKGATPLIKTDIDDDSSYEKLLKNSI
jgi:hypothetical protein